MDQGNRVKEQTTNLNLLMLPALVLRTRVGRNVFSTLNHRDAFWASRSVCGSELDAVGGP